MHHPDTNGLLSVVVIVAAFVALAVYMRRRRLVAMRAGLFDAGAADARIAGMSSVTGTVQGRPLRYVVSGADFDRSPRKWVTTASASLPPGAALLEMHLTPQTSRDPDLVARGLEIDVTVGEPLFDAAFVVEAAPAETARAVLDAKTRSTLRALLPCELHVAGGEVMFRKKDNLSEAFEVREVASLVAGVATRTGSVGLELEDGKLRALGEAGGYRGVSAADAGALLAGEGTHAELAQLRAVRSRRRARNQTMVLILLLAVGLVVMLFALMRR